MPYIKVQTNQEVASKKGFLKKLSTELADKLGKPESYIMTALQPELKMTFAGTTKKTAFVELKSIGLDESLTEDLSSFICDFVEAELGIDQDRIYIDFSDSAGSMWGWDGGTF